jgi:hypothetical protein
LQPGVWTTVTLRFGKEVKVDANPLKVMKAKRDGVKKAAQAPKPDRNATAAQAQTQVRVMMQAVMTFLVLLLTFMMVMTTI